MTKKRTGKRTHRGGRLQYLYTFWNFVVVVSVIGGLYALHLTLSPKIYIEPDLRRVPDNPFSTSFRIRNDGYISIKNVEFQYLLKDIYWERSNNRITNAGITYGDNKILLLKPNQTETAFRLSTPLFSSEPATSATIEIIVRYERYWPPPFKTNAKFGFTLTTTSGGAQVWQHMNN